MDNSIDYSLICSTIIAVAGVASPLVLEVIKHRSDSRSRIIDLYSQHQVAAHKEFIKKFNEFTAFDKAIGDSMNRGSLYKKDYEELFKLYGDMLTVADNAAIMSSKPLRDKILFIVSTIQLSDGQFYFTDSEATYIAFNEYLELLNEEYNQTVFKKPLWKRFLNKIVKPKKR